MGWSKKIEHYQNVYFHLSMFHFPSYETDIGALKRVILPHSFEEIHNLLTAKHN
jgi:hypothetical protein